MKFYRSIVVGVLYFSGCCAMEQSNSNAGSTSAATHSFVINVSEEKIQAPESTYGEAWLRYGQYCQNVRAQSTSAENSQRSQNDHHLVAPSDEIWSYMARQRQAEQRAELPTSRLELQFLMQILQMRANRIASLSSGSWGSTSSEPSMSASVSSSTHDHNVALVKSRN